MSWPWQRVTLRDSLAETGALENDFSKYEAGPSTGNFGGGRGGGEGEGGAPAVWARAADDGDVGRLAAELPPRWRGRT